MRLRCAHPLVAQGDPVRLTFTVCRTRPWPTVTSSGNRTQVGYEWRVLADDGEVVADNLHEARTLDLFSVWWLLGQCRSGHDDWDQRYWNRDDQPVHDGALLGGPQRGERVEPGTYRFQGALAHGPVGRSSTRTSPRAELTVSRRTLKQTCPSSSSTAPSELARRTLSR